VIRAGKATSARFAGVRRELTAAGHEVQVLAATDLTGRVMWVPFSFGGFGVGDPMCSALLTPITAFAVDFTLRKRDGELLPHAGFNDLKKTLFFLGDYEAWGINMYGTKFAKLPKLRRIRDGRGLALCALNDTVDLVM
jgi:hypothetical protein